MEPVEYEALVEGLPQACAWLLLGVVAAYFYVLYAVARAHFVPGLRAAARLLRLPPAVAGATLLALGNGAPDLFTAVSGAGRAPALVLSAAAGSCLFSLTVVCGAVVLSAPKEDTEREVYDDEEEGGKAVNSRVEDGSDAQAKKTRWCSGLRGRVQRMSRVAFLRAVAIHAAALGALAYLSLSTLYHWAVPAAMVVVYVAYVCGVVGAMLWQRQAAPQDHSPVHATLDDEMERERRTRAYLAWAAMGLPSQVLFVLRHGIWRPMVDGGVLSAAANMAAAPVDAVLALSILPQPRLPERQAKAWVAGRILDRVRVALWPFGGAVLALVSTGHTQAVLDLPLSAQCGVAGGLMFVSVGLWATTAWTEPPKFAAIHVAASLACCVLWTMAVSSNAVSALCALGNVLDIPDTLLGVLVLAWGNTFGDLVTNAAVAAAGAPESAIAAVYGGPAQNVLLSLGAALLLSGKSAPLALDSAAVYAALIVCAFLAAAGALCVPALWRMRVPRLAGAVLVAVYVAFVPLALFLSFFPL